MGASRYNNQPQLGGGNRHVSRESIMIDRCVRTHTDLSGCSKEAVAGVGDRQPELEAMVLKDWTRSWGEEVEQVSLVGNSRWPFGGHWTLQQKRTGYPCSLPDPQPPPSQHRRNGCAHRAQKVHVYKGVCEIKPPRKIERRERTSELPCSTVVSADSF